MAFKEVYFRKDFIMKAQFKFIFIFTVLLISYNTTFSQKEAKEFINNQLNTNTQQIVYLKCTNELIKTDLNLLKDVKEDSIISIFKKEVVEQMNYLGFKVIETDVLPTNISNNESTVNIAQLEIEEYTDIDSITSSNSFPSRSYYLNLNGVRVNCWLIYNESDTNSKEIFYCDENMRDYFDGYIEQNEDGKTYANYTITKINPNDAYITAFQSATTAANYFFNFLMNRYVWIKTNGMDKNYYGIDSDKSLIIKPTPFDNFDVIKE